jgi:peroxiredoxin
MPCRDYLAQLREAHPQITAIGAGVVAVGGAAPYQARDLMDRGMPFPCLLDPQHNLSRALDLGRIPWRAWLWPRTYVSYLRGARRARQGRISVADALRTPGVAIIDPQGRLAWIHRGETLGDYPPVRHVIAELQRLIPPPDG